MALIRHESGEDKVFRRCGFGVVEFQEQMITKTTIVEIEKLLEVASVVAKN